MFSLNAVFSYCPEKYIELMEASVARQLLNHRFNNVVLFGSI
jgi:hypothetical protein